MPELQNLTRASSSQTLSLFPTPRFSLPWIQSRQDLGAHQPPSPILQANCPPAQYPTEGKEVANKKGPPSKPFSARSSRRTPSPPTPSPQGAAPERGVAETPPCCGPGTLREGRTLGTPPPPEPVPVPRGERVSPYCRAGRRKASVRHCQVLIGLFFPIKSMPVSKRGFLSCFPPLILRQNS